MKAELIYVEKIEVSGLWLDITRQKNTPDGEWYGITLIGDGKIISDNESWIFDTFYPMLKEDKKRALKEIKVDYNKETAKAFRQLIKEALKLGWFHEEK